MNILSSLKRFQACVSADESTEGVAGAEFATFSLSGAPWWRPHESNESRIEMQLYAVWRGYSAQTTANLAKIM